MTQKLSDCITIFVMKYSEKKTLKKIGVACVAKFHISALWAHCGTCAKINVSKNELIKI